MIFNVLGKEHSLPSFNGLLISLINTIVTVGKKKINKYSIIKFINNLIRSIQLFYNKRKTF